jgi:UDP-N-acetylmuramate--alanine ligase
LLLLDVYPSREQPIEGVTSELILNAALAAGMKSATSVHSIEELPEVIRAVAVAGDIVLTIGAGTITEAGPKILSTIAEEPNEVSSNGVLSITAAQKSK